MQVYVDMIKNKMVDVVVSTGASIVDTAPLKIVMSPPWKDIPELPKKSRFANTCLSNDLDSMTGSRSCLLKSSLENFKLLVTADEFGKTSTGPAPGSIF